MTWPHAIRLSNLLVGAVKKNKDKVLETIRESYDIFEKENK